MINELFTMILTAAMLGVVWWDGSRYVIPNGLNLGILALFVVGCFFLPIPLVPSVAAAVGVFALGLGIFALGLMGGGDVKLLAVLSLWAGWPGAAYLIFLTALFGGALVLMVLPSRLLAPRLWPKLFPGQPLPRILTHKEPTPYGLAIATAFLFMLWTGQIGVVK